MAEIIALEATLQQRTSAQSTDAELVSAVRYGDDRAFEELFGRYHRRISAYVFGMVKDHARAEDVTQDVFLSALRRMRATDRPIAFKPWIYEIAKNACIDQFRRARRGEEVSIDADDGAGLGSADHAKLVSAELQPHARLEVKEDLDHLQGAFGGLNESHHRILVMREFEGLSYREIGERMGMSRPSVESTLFRARKRLAEEYDELVTGERCRRVHLIIEAAAGSTLGARDQRRLARHVSHCQPCRRHAALAGLGHLVPARTGVRSKIAALLPLPGVLRERWLGLGDGRAYSGGTITNWAVSMAPSADAGWAKAAAAAATVAVAGVGAGAVTSTHPSAIDRPAGASALMASHDVTSTRHAAAPLVAGSAAVPKLSTAALTASSAAQAATTPAPAASTPVPAAAPTASAATPATSVTPNAGPATTSVPPVRTPAAPAIPTPVAGATPAPLGVEPVTSAAGQAIKKTTGAVTQRPWPLAMPQAAGVGETIDDSVEAVQQTVETATDAVGETATGVADALEGVLSSTLNAG